LQTQFKVPELQEADGSAAHKIKTMVGSVSSKIGTSFRGSEVSIDKDGQAVGKQKHRSMWVRL
jgi:hypothetical protein